MELKMTDRPTSPPTQERGVNTNLHLPNGPSIRRSRAGSISRQLGGFVPVIKVTVIKDTTIGYGMKVSGDNPVFVQSVKEGGAAEKAGLHSGDRIIQVNGADVTHSTHTEVVELIKSCDEVELTVQQRTSTKQLSPPMSTTQLVTSLAGSRCPSPAPPTPTSPNQTSPTTVAPVVGVPRPLHHHHSAPARDRITAPLPVDHEKLRQLECQRVQTFRLWLEKEQRYVEALQSEQAKCIDPSCKQQISRELFSAERRVRTLQEQLISAMTNSNSHDSVTNGLTDMSLLSSTPPPPPPLSTLPTRQRSINLSSDSSFDSTPPPLPSRMHSFSSSSTVVDMSPPPLPPRPQLASSPVMFVADDDCPSSPLLVHHQRTKSNPDQMIDLSMSLPTEGNPCSRLNSTESRLNSESYPDLSSWKKRKGGVSWNVDAPLITSTPPGTPPPPYRGESADREQPPPPRLPPLDYAESNDDIPDVGGISASNTSLTNNSPSNTSVQTSIMSMEDDDMSDQDISQFEDHGPFKSLTKLWEHNAHLAVFLNYVLSNCDPSSILFYLLTDLYKEGNIKEMRKWAYELHSTFLVPDAPLRLNNVDENIAREIDDVLVYGSDKEEILRKIFWKARQKAKEELNEQLADFQQKRTAGLGMLYGPSDDILKECMLDKSKELKVVEQILVPKLEPFVIDIEKDGVDDRNFAKAAALGTIMSKIFGIRGQQLLERCPTFVSKDKSMKSIRMLGRSRKILVKGHQLVAHQYFTVTYCNHCQLIIWGIGPQGYQCTICLLNIHRPCEKVLEENCPGPLKRHVKMKFIDRLPKRTRISERTRRNEEKDFSTAMIENEIGDRSCSSSKGSNKLNNSINPDSLRDSLEKTNKFLVAESNHLPDTSSQTPQQTPSNYKSKPSGAINIIRSESYKERAPQKKTVRERRKTSDPNLSKTNTDVDVDSNAQFPYPAANSDSSSNSNLSSRSLDSPSNSLEVVGSNNRGSCDPANASPSQNNTGCSHRTSAWDSDTEAEPDPPDWIKNVPPDVLVNLTAKEKKRQEVINELFHTERSHVRALKILDLLFYKPMKEQLILPYDQLQLLFPNLEEMLEIHSQFNNNMKQRKKENPVVAEVGDILLKMFDGSEGEIFEKAAANFCSRQQIALESLKERRRKDPVLNKFLTDAEGNPICRRLQLKDIIPTGMLRLTKYPLLFENLAKYTESNEEEKRRVLRALERSREILNRVNEAVKQAEDQHRLAEIQRRLDKSPFDKVEHIITNEFKNLDLTTHKLIHEGVLTLRIPSKQKLVDVHVLLLEDVIILLQKQDEKYILKFFNNSVGSERSTICSPIIKVSTAMPKINAVDSKSLYLINMSHNVVQMYDLVATSTSEINVWFKHITEATEAYKTKEGKHRNSRPSELLPVHTSHDYDSGAASDIASHHSKTRGNDDNLHNDHSASNLQQDDISHSELSAKKLGGGTSPAQQRKKRGTSVEPPRLTTEDPLVEPTQVLVSQRPVHTAEPVLTPLERLRRLDESIREALLEKQKLVADILHVPKGEFENIADLAAEPAVNKEASELFLAAVNQADQLTIVLNESLRVTEEDAVSAGTETHGARLMPSVPAPKLHAIAASLTANLTQLSSVIMEWDEERGKLRHELQKSREQLHAVYETQQRDQQQADGRQEVVIKHPSAGPTVAAAVD